MTVKLRDKSPTLLSSFMQLTPLIGEEEQLRHNSKALGVSAGSASELCYLLCGPPCKLLSHSEL